MQGDNEVFMITQGDTRIWPQYLNYFVSYTLNGITTDGSDRALESHSFTATLIPESGKQVLYTSVKVVMGEVDITDDSYDFETNTIKISSVTDNVSITAIGATVPSEYKVIPWIYHVGSNSPIAISYYPNNNTTMKMDVKVRNYSNNEVLFGTYNYSTKPSFAFFTKFLTQDRSAYFYYQDSIGGTSANRIGNGIRQIVEVNKNKITYTNKNNTRTTLIVNSTGTFTTPNTRALALGGLTTTYRCRCDIYRTTIKEEDVDVVDLVPVERVADGLFGLYDVVNGTAYIKTRAQWLGTYVGITRNLTNCTQTALGSSHVAAALFWENWESKFTADSGYTFNGGTFQVMVNGVDVTSDCTTYDSTDDSWSVSLVAHWKDTIIITATAV